MFKKFVLLASGLLIGLTDCELATPLHAQDFRVYTRLTDHTAVPRSKTKLSTEPNQEMRHSLTLFHAGKAYDYLMAADEMTIFEPAAKRFTIISGARNMATEVTFESIEQALDGSRQRAVREGKQLPAAIKFQLNPAFSESFDKKKSQLTLTSKYLTYSVHGTGDPAPEMLDSYLRYTDWTAKLNFVLHPQFFPGPRLALDEALRQRSLLPTDVELDIKSANGIHRHAAHQFQEKLEVHDRQMIHHWETKLAGGDLKRVGFDAFQKALLDTELHARRK